MKKIKVLQFPIANANGGITQYALKNWKFIDKNKFQFDFATLSKSIDFADEVEKQGCKIHYISCYAEENKEQFIKEINEIFDEEYDVVHLHTSYWKSFLVEELAKKRNIPKIIVHSHSTGVLGIDEREEARRLHNLRRSQFSPKLATDFWACSQAAANWLFGQNIPKDKIKIIKNAIDLEAFTYNKRIRADYRKKMGFEDYFVLGHVGRFAYEKNHEFLIDVFAEVSKRVFKARLLLIGTGKLEEAIRRKVNQYKLVDKVLFLEKRNDVNNLMQAMDLFLLPSLFEGLGLVLLEAQASGLKCIVNTCIPEEAKITKNIESISLIKEKWVEKICSISCGYDRVSQDRLIAEAGYDIRNQIKIIENLYKI